MLELRFAKPTVKSLTRMPTGIAKRIRAELNAVASSPSSYRGDWKPLQGSAFWRLRVGDWRAICDVRNDEMVLLVLKIASRGDAYK